MDQATYQRWWPLHLRVARGEELSAEERPLYEAGLRQVEQDDLSAVSATAIQEARAAVAVLETEHAALVARRRQLDEEIASLEKALGQQARDPLGVED